MLDGEDPFDEATMIDDEDEESPEPAPERSADTGSSGTPVTVSQR